MPDPGIQGSERGKRARFSDTTYRDGSQSLWALGMRGGMIEATAELMDQAGFEAIEVPVTGIFVKKFVRDLKEDSWAIARMMARKIRRTVKQNMGGAFFHPFEAPPPRSIIELFFKRVVETGALDRIQVSTNTLGQLKGPFPWLIPMFRNLGLQISLAISYSLSPRHTDEYYAQKMREVVAWKPDIIYLKDQGGLLTIDRIRTLFPIMLENAGGVPVELHSHCTTGLAPIVYLEALKMGASVLHTAVPPLANGSAQPSIFNVASNARLMGYQTSVDEKILRTVCERLTAIARQDKLPIGAPLEYDYAQYIHQVPGGVISNLKHQLTEMRCLHLLDKVLEESVQVRKDLGYPIMITPHSQFVVTQATLNVTMGERYKHVIDEIILFALGVFGEDSGQPWMDQNLKEKLLSDPRAKELKEMAARRMRDVPLEELRRQLGGPGVSDEEFLLRYIMKGEVEIQAMRAAGPPRQYFITSMPMITLIQE
ncbi:MAG: hypothetical protein HYY28_01540, partial [Betaproteobacteria bacterium]|nr:hypothetical protein [Betaproteobacteria bacterium]